MPAEDRRDCTRQVRGNGRITSKAFFTDALLERTTGLYGVRPDAEFVQIATLMENARA